MNIDTATFGAGCFWCVEAIFQQIDGVLSVIPGYEGGTTDNPTYKEVCSGETGHAEVCQIKFDKTKISYTDLLEVFWSAHDPTTPNQQGGDIGTQYRSIIFYHSREQMLIAETYKQKLNISGAFNSAIVTEISPSKTFYKAEDYHQNYFNNNSNESYCRIVIAPKLDKLKKVFKKKLRSISK